MADGGCGGGCAEWQPIYDRVRSQAEALAADRARPEAASKVQRESWDAARRLQRSVEELQAAARQKDAEIGRLRAEAAGASKKLQEARQVGASRRMRWEAACVELLLGANQKLAELRDGDMEDSRICAETPNSKEVESCAKLSQSTMDQACVASDLGTELRKLKQSYVTLSSKKDQEVSALLSEKELARNQLVVMQKDYDALLRNKKGETAQATEAAQKLQQSVDDLKVLAEKKDDEIGRLRAEAVAAEKTLQKMQSLVKEKDDEIERLKGRHSESIEKRNKDTSQMHKKSRLDDPTATGRGKPSGSLREMVEENYSFETETVEKNGQDETSQKCRRVSSSSISNDDEESGGDADDDEQNGSYEDDNEQSGSDEDGDEQSRSNEDADEQTRSDDDDGQSRSDEHDEDEDEQSKRDLEMTNNRVQKLLRNPKRKRGKNHTESNEAVRTQWYWHDRAPAPLYSRKVQIINGQHSVLCTGNWAQFVRDVKVCLADQPKKPKEFVRFLCNFENWRIKDVARTMAVLLDGHPKLQRRFNRFLPHNCQIEVDKQKEEHHPDDQLRIYQRRDRGRPILRGVPRARRRLPRDQSQGAGTAAQAVPPRLASETARSISGICNPICTFRDPVSFKQGGGGESGQGCCSGTGTHVVDGAREPQQRDTLRVTNGAVDRGNAPADAL